LPKSAVKRAKVRQLVQIICADTQPLQNLPVLAEAGGADAARKADWARKWISRGLLGTSTLSRDPSVMHACMYERYRCAYPFLELYVALQRS
jgi:hypothetical protein